MSEELKPFMVGKIPPSNYPNECRFMEMTLVKMLIDRRSWADRVLIVQAIDRIRKDAEDMRKEREQTQADCGSAQ